MSLFKTKLTALSAAMLLAGCASFKSHELVETQNHAYFASQAYLAELKQADSGHWWYGYQSSELNELIKTALENNHSLRAAQHRYRAALAQLGYQSDQYLPQGGVSAEIERQKLTGDITNQTSVGLSATWEIDLFGRISSLVNAAQAQTYQAAEARVQLMAEVVTGVTRSYFEWQGNQLKLDLVNAQIAALEESLQVLQARVDEGFVSSLDVERTLAQLNQQKTLLPIVKQALYQSQASLAVLLGVPAEQVKLDYHNESLDLALAAPFSLYQPEFAVKLKPEINIAMYQLAEQSALDEASQAALYPSISLTGFAGWINTDGTRLSSNESWSVTPGISWSILSWPALQNQADAQAELTQAAYADYENTLVRVISEAQNSLKAMHYGQQLNAFSQQRVFHALSALEQAQALYEEGSVPYLDLLNARQEALQAERDSLDAKISLIQARVSTYNAFSGGWSRTVLTQ